MRISIGIKCFRTMHCKNISVLRYNLICKKTLKILYVKKIVFVSLLFWMFTFFQGIEQNLHNQADISAAQLKKLAAHIGASFSHELCGHRNPSYLFTRRKVISFFNFSFFYFFSCIFAEIDFLLSSCRASISESEQAQRNLRGQWRFVPIDFWQIP